MNIRGDCNEAILILKNYTSVIRLNHKKRVTLKYRILAHLVQLVHFILTLSKWH